MRRSMEIKTLFRIFTPENKAAVAAVFIFWSINSVCYLFILYWNLGNFKAMKGRTSCKRPRIGVDVTCLFHRLPRAAIQGELVHVFFVCLRYISEDMA